MISCRCESRVNTLPQSSCTRIFWCKSGKYLSMKINRMWIKNKHFASVKLSFTSFTGIFPTFILFSEFRYCPIQNLVFFVFSPKDPGATWVVKFLFSIHTSTLFSYISKNIYPARLLRHSLWFTLQYFPFKTKDTGINWWW